MASPEEMAATMRNNVPEKTGKTQQQWSEIISNTKLEKHGQILKHLKSEYAVTHGFANLIAHDFLNADNQETDLVAQQYAGAKQPLKVIYDELTKAVSTFGEFEVAPKKAYVSLRRNKQFALIQASTKTRVDVGINLKGEAETERLEKSDSFNGMVSHRVRISDVSEVDDELITWLKRAYSNS